MFPVSRLLDDLRTHHRQAWNLSVNEGAADNAEAASRLHRSRNIEPAVFEADTSAARAPAKRVRSRGLAEAKKNARGIRGGARREIRGKALFYRADCGAGRSSFAPLSTST
jgi:hypothetical protein